MAGLRRARRADQHPRRQRPARLRRARGGPGHDADRDPLVQPPLGLAPHLLRRARAPPDAALRRHRAGRGLAAPGPRDARLVLRPHDDGQRGRGELLRRRRGQDDDDPDRVLRPQLLDRRQLPAPERGAAVPRPRDRARHVGGRLPALRGQLPLHDRGAAGGLRRLSPSPTCAPWSSRRRPPSTGSTSTGCGRSATASARWWPRWPGRWRPRTGRPRRPATRSTPRRSCVPGEQRGRTHDDRPLRRPRRAGEPRDRGQEGRHLVRGGHRRLRDRSRDHGRRAAAAARARPRAAGAHHHHPGRDARAARLRRRLDRRAGAPRGPAGRVPDLHADDDRAVAHRRPRDQRRAQEAGRGRGAPRRRPTCRPASRAWARSICEITGRGQRDPRELRAGEDRLLVQAVAVVRGGRRARPGPAARLRREDGADAAARVDRRRADPEGGAARPGGRPGRAPHGRPQLDGAGLDPGRAASSGRCRGRRSSPSSTSATTTSRCSGRSDERPLPDHLGRRPRRPALPRGTGPTSTRPTTASSTSTWPSARPTATSCCR